MLFFWFCVLWPLHIYKTRWMFTKVDSTVHFYRQCAEPIAWPFCFNVKVKVTLEVQMFSSYILWTLNIKTPRMIYIKSWGIYSSYIEHVSRPSLFNVKVTPEGKNFETLILYALYISKINRRIFIRFKSQVHLIELNWICLKLFQHILGYLMPFQFFLVEKDLRIIQTE